MAYRIIRTHVETYVVDNIEANTSEEAIRIAENDIDPGDFDLVESSAYEYEAIPMDKLWK